VDGILVASDLYDGRAHTQTVVIDHNTASYNGRDGIEVANLVGNTTGVSGTVLTQSVQISYNVANGNGQGSPILIGAPLSPEQRIGLVDAEGGIGIAVENFALDGGTISQGLAIVGNIANSNVGFSITRFERPADLISDTGIGIGLLNEAEGGTISQIAAIIGNTANYNSRAGIIFGNIATHEGSLAGFIGQQVEGDSNFVSANGEEFLIKGAPPIGIVPVDINGVGIGVGNFAYEHGSISQALNLVGNTIQANRAAGMSLVNVGVYNASVTQTGSIGSNLIDHNSGGGIDIFNQTGFDAPPGSDGTAISQSLSIAGNVIHHNQNGIVGYNFADNETTVSQSLVISGNSIYQNRTNGVQLGNDVHDVGVVTQSVSIEGNTIADNGEDGIAVRNYASFATVTQVVAITGNSIVQNDWDGIYVRNRARSESLLQQSLNISANTILDSREDGIGIFSQVSGGTTFGQFVTISGNSIDNSISGDGIQIRFRGEDGASASQAITVAGNWITNSNDYGVKIVGYISQAGSKLTQNVTISGNVVDRVINEDGIFVRTAAKYGADATQTVSITGNSVNDPGEDGIYVAGRVKGAGSTLTQSVSISGNNIGDGVHNIGDEGIQVATYASFGTLTQTLLSITDNTLSDVNDVGIELNNEVRGQGTIVQASISAPATIADNTITWARVGIGIYNSINGGTFSQAVLVSANTVTHADFGIQSRDLERFGASFSEAVALTDNTLNNVSNGIVASSLIQTNANGTSNLTIGGNRINVDGGQTQTFGIAVSTAVSLADLTEGVSITNNVIGKAGPKAVAGIAVYTDVDFLAAHTQSVVITGNTVASGFTAGIGVENAATAAELDQNLTISGNQIGAARYAGIGLVNKAEGGLISQVGTISGNVVAGQTGFSGGGLVAFNYADTAAITQGLTLTNNTFSGNNANGVYLKVFANNVAGAAQTVTLSGNVLNHNNDGLRAVAGGTAGVAVQNVTFVSGSNNTVSYNNLAVFGSHSGIAVQNISLGNSIFTSNGAFTSGNASFSNP
jgi:hypothetical protein